MNVADLLGHIGFEIDASPLDSVNERLEGIKKRLEYLGAVELLRGFFEMTERFSGFAESLGSAASAAGLSVEALQRLQFAAGQAGVSSEDMGTALSVLARKLYDARQGGDEAVKSFAAVGIAPEQINSFNTTSDALAAIADRIAGISDPIKKQALTLDLLGRGSSKMVKFLSEGSGAMSKAGAAAQAMGAVVSGPAVEALQEVEDALSGFWQTVKAFAATVAGMFAPAIKAAVRDFQQFYAANRAVIMLNVRRWIEDLMFAFGYMVGVVETVTSKVFALAAAHPLLVRRIGEAILALGALSVGAGVVGRVLGLLKDAAEVAGGGLGVLKSALGVVGGAAGLFRLGLVAVLRVIGTMVAVAFPALGTAIQAFGAMLAATPIGLFVGGMAALVLSVEAIYTTFFKKGGNFKETWIYKIFEKLAGAAGWLKGKLGFGTEGDTRPAVEGAAKGTPAAAPEGLAAAAGGAIKGAVGRVQALGDRWLERLGMGDSKPPGEGGAEAPPPMLARVATTVQDVAAMRAEMPGNRGAMLAAGQGAAPAGAPQSTINAPITINVPQGTPVQDVAQKAKDALGEHLNRIHREAQRTLRTAQAY